MVEHDYGKEVMARYYRRSSSLMASESSTTTAISMR